MFAIGPAQAVISLIPYFSVINIIFFPNTVLLVVGVLANTFIITQYIKPFSFFQSFCILPPGNYTARIGIFNKIAIFKPVIEITFTAHLAIIKVPHPFSLLPSFLVVLTGFKQFRACKIIFPYTNFYTMQVGTNRF